MANKKVAVYTRVSTGYQIDKDSLPFQRKECTDYARRWLHAGKDDIEVFEDAGKSGKNTDRPGFQRMMGKIRAGQISYVVVYKIDRISRNLVDFSIMYDELKKYHVTFISLREQFDTSSAAGEAVLKIILVFAELERKMTSERVTAIMIDRANAKKWNGARMPFGWEWNDETKMPEHDPVEAPLALQMYEVYDRTHSTAKVRDYLYDHNIQTKRGGRWNTTTICGFLRNPMNKGDYRYNYRESARGVKKPEDQVIYIPDVFPPLVSRDLWERVNRQLSANARGINAPGMSHDRNIPHVFAGILVCAKCGAGFQVEKLDKPRANGFRPTTYICTGRRTYRSCDAPGASDVVLGPFFFNFISNFVYAIRLRGRIDSADQLQALLLNGPEFDDVSIDADDLDSILAAIRSGSGRQTYSPDAGADPRHSSDISVKKAEETRLTRALERLKKAYLFSDDAMPEAEYIATRAELTEKLTRIRNEIADAESEEPETDSLEFVRAASSFLISTKLQTGEHIDYPEFAASTDARELQQFVRAITDHIVVDDRRPVEIVFRNGMNIHFIWN